MKYIRWVALPALLLLIGCSTEQAPQPDDGTIRIGKQAPEITATTIDGNRFQLSDHRGKVVVLEFWATWCGPCVKKMPFMKQLHEKYKDKSLVIVGISQDEDRRRMLDFVAKHELPWIQIHDVSGASGGDPIGMRWKIFQIPQIYVLDHNGVIRYMPQSEAQIERAVKDLVSDIEVRNRP